MAYNRIAQRQYYENHKAKVEAQRELVDGRWVATHLHPKMHGQSETYNNWACRCVPCTEANAHKQADYRQQPHGGRVKARLLDPERNTGKVITATLAEPTGEITTEALAERTGLSAEDVTAAIRTLMYHGWIARTFSLTDVYREEIDS